MSEAASSGGVSLCTLRAVNWGDVILLDAVGDEVAGHADLFFTHDSAVEAIRPGVGVSVTDRQVFGGALKLSVQWGGGTPLTLSFGDTTVQIPISAPDLGRFAGRNVGLACRNGERVGLVMDWLRYHHETHAMNGAVILSRARAGSEPSFASELNAAVEQSGIDLSVLLVGADHPFGQKDLPPEAHPFCVPEAPGKDRMEIPRADPWSAPLAEKHFHEWARLRFLVRARAVANIDVHDLLADADGVSVFDQALASTGGYIPLLGRHCYPWRARDSDAPEFSDHVCVQFDASQIRRRWCVAPEKLPPDSVWRLLRIGGTSFDRDEIQSFYRCMSLRHSTGSVSQIVPKSSLIRHPPLARMMQRHFDGTAVLPPPEQIRSDTNGRRAIVTTMKNEGPFILEWVAYHRAIGFDDFLIYSNDCTDGTDTMLELLQSKGVVQHRDNPFRQTGLKPQHAALAAAESEPVIAEAEWVVCMDVDEYVNIKCGDGTLDALFAETAGANMISMTWRLFGNADIHAFDPDFITRQFTSCAPELTRKPHQAWGFKTLYRNSGIFRKLGVHRPKGLKPQLWEEIRWVNGSGHPMPRDVYRNAWRSTISTVGYDLVQLNHYAVRSAESFLVKRDRGRVNHVDRDQGLAYWFRMNNNADSDHSIQRMLPRMQAEFDRLMRDPDIAAAHDAAVTAHRARIDTLRASAQYSGFYSELTGSRLEKLSRMHSHFGANVFLRGPEAIPAEIVERDPAEDFFFTVEPGDTEH